MKRFKFAAFSAVLFALFVSASAQDMKQMGKDEHKQMQVMEMEKDSSMMDRIMDRIVSDEHMRMMMMEKMMHHAKADSGSMMAMCGKMMDDSEMHSMMKKMMGGGMMRHGMMKMKPADPKKGQMEKKDQKKHH